MPSPSAPDQSVLLLQNLSRWKIASWGTTACCVVLSVLMLISSVRKDSLGTISLSSNLHLTDRKGDLAFYNNLAHGPYHGSLLSLDGIGGPSETRGYGRSYGVYYRYFRRDPEPANASTGPEITWTLSISLWWPILIFGAASTLCWWKVLSIRRVMRQR